jgi:CDP-diacylglycerol--serine O-phosphatidyltransferase
LNLLLNSWFWYALIAVAAYLMVSTIPMMGLKFKDLTIKINLPKILFLISAVIAGVFLKWLAVPIVFIIYVILSLVMLPKESANNSTLRSIE